MKLALVNEAATVRKEDEFAVDDAVLQDRDARPWQRMLDKAEDYFKAYNDAADAIDKDLGTIERLSKKGVRRAFQIFYANVEVLKPSVYARPPIPIVEPVFKTRDPVKTMGAQLLERALITYVRKHDLNRTLKGFRDDMLIIGRAVPWFRLEIDETETPAAAVDHVRRKDFLMSPCRDWSEARWVARRGYLTREEMRERFAETSQGAYERAQYEQQNVGGSEDGNPKVLEEKRAEVWEIWHKEQNVVVWITPGVDEVLDAERPYLSLEGFWPCPEPAISFQQRETVIPVPDYLFYRDQVQEIDDLTARISSNVDALRVKGFYDGAGDAAASIKKAWAAKDDSAVLIAVSDLRQLATSSGGNIVEWMPILQIAQTVQVLVEQRRELLSDVYEITGLSDLRRGQTNPNETATAQRLKAESGNHRVRGRQEEMVRIGQNILAAVGELMAEHYSPETLREMAQLEEDLPTDAELQARANQVAMQAQASGADPQQAQMQAQQMLDNTVTLEAVAKMLQDERMRPYEISIETDSTIQPDEDAEKQRRLEYMEVIGGLFQQALPVAQAAPETGPFIAEALKFVNGGFRAGRDMDSAVEDFGDQLLARAQQAQTAEPPPDPEMLRVQADQEAARADQQLRQQEAQARLSEAQQRAQIDGAKVEVDRQAAAAKAQADAAKAENDRRLAELKIREEAAVKVREAELRADVERDKMEAERARHRAELAQKSELARLDLAAKIEIEIAKLRAQPAPAQQGEGGGSTVDVGPALEKLEEMLAALTAPKRIIYDDAGEIVGSEVVLK